MKLRSCALAAVALSAALHAQPLMEFDLLPADSDNAEPPRTRSLQPMYPYFDPMDPEGEPPEYAGVVEAHNVWRRDVGVPELRGWSTKAAIQAQSWAEELAKDGCQMRHSQSPERKKFFGENIYRYWSSRAYEPWKRDAKFITDAWATEKPWFNAQDNTCDPPVGGTCGHYTAMVWQQTYLIGCGRAHCGESEVWVCNYYPRGNYYGMRPFQVADAQPAAQAMEPPAALPAMPESPPAAPVPAQAEPAAPAQPSTDLFGDVPAVDPLLPEEDDGS